MTDFTIRPYQPKDEPAIVEIVYRTGFKGEDLTGRRYFDDQRLFFLLFAAYYPRYEPQHCFVAATAGDAAVGYILGTPDTVAQERAFQRHMLWRILARVALATIWRYPQTFKTLLEMRKMEAELSRRPRPPRDWLREYPAHLHIDLLPEYQGQGLGSRLMQCFEAHLRELPSPGVHLQTSNHNRKAVPFYYKMGFTLLNETPVKSHPTLHDLVLLTFAKRLT